jgi:hypothetical protein
MNVSVGLILWAAIMNATAKVVISSDGWDQTENFIIIQSMPQKIK